MAKASAPLVRNIKESIHSVTKQIDVNFRSYALYVLEHRGIPSFYDGLTNVQRFALMNAPKSFDKTIGLVGKCISDGYHHGNSSLEGAINKITKDFGCSEQLLLGDGFFGTPVKPEASAARYTSVRLNPVINEIISKFAPLNKKNDDDQWEYIRTDIPIGLCTMVVGIAVGYKSTLLPRNPKEVQEFLDGKKTPLIPYFKGFRGKVSAFNGMKKTWLIEGLNEIDETKKTVRILDLPPVMKYQSFIKKLDKFSENSKVDFHVDNSSRDSVDISLKYKSGETWEFFRDKIEKMTKMIVTETLVLVKDSQVIEYVDLTDYFNEFKIHRESVRLERSVYDIEVHTLNLAYYEAKKKYLEFMLAKKRTEPEIDTFLESFDPRIRGRLESTLLRHLSQENLKKTVQDIADMKVTLKKEETNKVRLEASLAKLQKDITIVGRSTKNRSSDLFAGEEEEIDGIAVFSPRSEDEEGEEIVEENDNELEEGI